MKMIPVISLAASRRTCASTTITAAVLGAVLLGGVSVMAATTSTNDWIAASPADWSVSSAANWSLTSPPSTLSAFAVDTNSIALSYGAPDNYIVGGLFIATNSFGTLNMTGGTLSVSNASGNYVFTLGGNLPGNGALGGNVGGPGIGNFNMSGGTLNVARDTGGFQQDAFIEGLDTGASGTFSMSGGVANIWCGMEIGCEGAGTINVSGGTLVDTGWFHIGEGVNSSTTSGSGSSTFNLSGGSIYVLPNNNGPTSSGINGGFTLGYDVSNAVANISGGSIYCIEVTLSDFGGSVSNTLNIAGGSIYVGSLGVQSNSSAGLHGANQVNISGGTFHTADMLIYGATGGVLGSTNNILADGTNWSWMATVPVNLTNDTFTIPNGFGGNGTGPGYVTFAPETNRTITLNNQWSGVGGMVVSGPGILAAGASNVFDFSSPLTVSGGTLAVNASGAFGTSFGGPLQINGGIALFNSANTYANSLVINGGVLALNAALDDTIGLTFNSGSVAILNSGSIADSPLNLPASGSLIFTNTSAVTLTNIIAGSGNVLVNNSGVVNLGSNLQNTGIVTQNNGVLVLSGTIFDPGSITNSGPASVGPLLLQGDVQSPIGIGTNSSLEMGGTVQPGTGIASNIVLNGTLIEKLNTATTVGSGVNDLLICSNLTLNPSSVLLITPLTAPSQGSYVIAEYTGALTGAFGTLNNETGDGMSLSYSTPGEIILNVGSVNQSSLVWAATNFNANVNWDVNTTSNWTNSATSTLTTFHQQDAVIFNAVPGTGVTNRVSVTGQVLPQSINISGGLPYLFSGTGEISGGTGINYNDTNTSGIYTSGNNFTGPVNINNGVLQLGSGGSSWLGVSNTVTVNGGTLDLNAQGIGSKPLVIQGTGSAFAGTNNGAINNSSTTSPGQSSGPLNITLAGNTTLNASGSRWDIGVTTLGAGGGSFAGNGYNLIKIGGSPIWMHEVGDIGVSTIDIQQGLLGFEYTIGMGNPSYTVTVESGATLGFYQVVSNLNKELILNGNATLSSGGGTGSSNNFIGPITLNGTNSITTSSFPLNLWGNITGTGGFNLSGTGPLYLGGADTYSGSTFIAANSVLALESGGSIPNTPLIYMTPGSNTVINASGAGSMVLNSGQTLEGSGSILGNVTANSGSSIILGTNGTSYGTIVFTNNLTLNGNTNYLKISDSANNGVDNDLIQVSGALTLTGVSTIIVTPLAALNSSAPYTVMEAAGGITGSAANLKIVSTSPRYTMTPVINGNLLQVNIMGNAGPLEWKGYLTSNWDLVTSNWYNMMTSSHDHFYTGDDPTFDDTATITNVVVTNNLTAGGIFMSNVLNTYTFSGGGVISGPLNMYGNGSTAGTLILAMSNAPALSYVDSQYGNLVYALRGVSSYTVTNVFGDSGFTSSGTIIFGGTNTAFITGDNSAGDVVGSLPAFDGTIWVTNGVLRYTNQDNFGDSTFGYDGLGPVAVVTNTGTLDFNNTPLTSVTPEIAGTGFNGEGALFDTTNNQASGNSGGAVEYYTLVGNASVGAPTGIRWDQNTPAGSVGGQINGNGFKLTKVGLGTVFIDGQQDGDTHFGDIEVAAGRLGFQGGPLALGNAYLNNILSVDSNAEVTFYAVSNEFDPVHYGIQKPVWLKGTAQFDSGGASNNYDGPVFLSGLNLFGTRSALHLWDSIMDSNGPGGFILGNDTVGGSGANLYLDGTNSYSGPTIVSNDTLTVGANSSLGLSTYVQVNSGAELDLSALPGYNFGTIQTNQTMAGNGTVIGPTSGSLNFNAGSTLAIGLPVTNNIPSTNIYALTIDNGVVFNAGSTDYVGANKTSAAAGAVPVDELTGPTSLTLGGTLVITNYGTSFVAGDSLALFSATAISTNSGFNIVPATPGPNTAWNIGSIPVNGTLSVVSTLTVNSNPTNIVFSVSGNHLTLSWPADHTGWELEMQTNSLSVGINTNWVPDPASTTVDSVVIPINLTNGTVFYRLVYPPQ
ncbi:MAG TPA: hypothetical protein VME24_07640 [Alphaproteobacteria bacterium]|nr:hypothetical protein [Alphaproteobacteria bacterium]